MLAIIFAYTHMNWPIHINPWTYILNAMSSHESMSEMFKFGNGYELKNTTTSKFCKNGILLSFEINAFE
jgi:hypothetical protein